MEALCVPITSCYLSKFWKKLWKKKKFYDQVKNKKELKLTNPLKINKRKRKQEDVIIKLIDNLPNHLKDKKDYFLKLKDSINISIACIKCRKYGNHIMECGKREKDKKDKLSILHIFSKTHHINPSKTL